MLDGRPAVSGGDMVLIYELWPGVCVLVVVAFVLGMQRGGSRLLVVFWLGRLLHRHHGEFFFNLLLHLCHAFLS